VIQINSRLIAGWSTKLLERNRSVIWA